MALFIISAGLMALAALTVGMSGYEAVKAWQRLAGEPLTGGIAIFVTRTTSVERNLFSWPDGEAMPASPFNPWADARLAA